MNKPPIRTIIDAMAFACRVQLGEIASNSRAKEITCARRVLTVLLYEDRGMSFPEIALVMSRKEGNRIAWHSYQKRHLDDVQESVASARVWMHLNSGEAAKEM